jgi:alcohol dehydrogenase (cytochrome c)
MQQRPAFTCLAGMLLAGTMLAASLPALATEVTAERLANVDREPHNWLMNHRSYESQRYSPLAKINTGTIKSLKLVYAVAIGGTTADENLEATPIAEDGFLYVVDQWGIVYKIDARSGDMGRIVWRMDPKQEKPAGTNRGVALWGNFVVSVASHPGRAIATDKESGKIVWETNLSDGQAALQFTAAPQAVKDKIVIGASGGDWCARFHRRSRCDKRQAALAQLRHPGPRRARQRNMERQEQRVANRRRRALGHW